MTGIYAKKFTRKSHFSSTIKSEGSEEETISDLEDGSPRGQQKANLTSSIGKEILKKFSKNSYKILKIIF